MRLFARSLIAFLRDYRKPSEESAIVKAMEAAESLGIQIGYLRGYRAGIADSRKLQEIRGGSNEARITVTGISGTGAIVPAFGASEPLKPTLRLVDDKDAS